MPRSPNATTPVDGTTPVDFPDFPNQPRLQQMPRHPLPAVGFVGEVDDEEAGGHDERCKSAQRMPERTLF
jgi:hypothetical protein